MHIPPHRAVSRGTFGEALIVITSMIGFFYGMNQGMFSTANMWGYVVFLLIIAGFYFLLLFARMLFFWMTGGEMNFSQTNWADVEVAKHHGEHLKKKVK